MFITNCNSHGLFAHKMYAKPVYFATNNTFQYKIVNSYEFFRFRLNFTEYKLCFLMKGKGRFDRLAFPLTHFKVKNFFVKKS